MVVNLCVVYLYTKYTKTISCKLCLYANICVHVSMCVSDIKIEREGN